MARLHRMGDNPSTLASLHDGLHPSYGLWERLLWERPWPRTWTTQKLRGQDGVPSNRAHKESAA